MGGLFVVVTLFYPKGIIGLLDNIRMAKNGQAKRKKYETTIQTNIETNTETKKILGGMGFRGRRQDVDPPATQ